MKLFSCKLYTFACMFDVDDCVCCNICFNELAEFRIFGADVQSVVEKLKV